MRYGAKGITVCERWMKYKNFKEDMLSSYQKGLTLERLDNQRGYFKENCKWATYKEQNNHKGNNRQITYLGITKNLTQWIEELDLKSSTVRQRFYVYKWNLDRCFSPNKGGY